ncbi:hypothetical protein NHQ30_010109 [Ciborinia camelliae]|nr:hypothetical protein NHQ30_010109 [Ciborinia camelliae]
MAKPKWNCNVPEGDDLPGSEMFDVWARFGTEVCIAKYTIRTENVRRQKSNSLIIRLSNTSYGSPVEVEGCFRAAFILLAGWLREGVCEDFSRELLRRSEAKETVGPSIRDPWPGTVLSLCILCDEWRCPIVFNEAIDHFALLHETQLVTPQNVWIIYDETRDKSCLRRLVIDIIASQGGGKGHLIYLELAKSRLDFMTDMWRRLRLPDALLFKKPGVVEKDRFVEYHMAV